jgi:hypothetical protein
VRQTALVPPRSVLELFHPTGEVPAIRVLGGALPSWQVPLPDEGPKGVGSEGLLLVAPTPQECAAHGWLDGALRQAEEVAGSGGVGYVLVQRRWRGAVTRRLRGASGVRVSPFVFLPNASRPAFIVPLAKGPLRYTLAQASALPHWLRRAASSGVVLTPVRHLLRALTPACGFAVTRRDAPPFAWLANHSALAQPLRHVVIRPSWRTGDAAVVLLGFSAVGDFPKVVAKAAVGPGSARACHREATNMEALRTDALAAGAEVPALLARITLGGLPVNVVTALPGVPASVYLSSHPDRALPLIERLAEWLLRWHQRTGQAHPVTHEGLERWIIEPARQLAPEIGGDFVGRLEDLCRTLGGTEVPMVTAHHDLTTRNVLVQGPQGLGIVDWEEAEASTLPLTDFYYATTDAVLAAAGGSRLEAFRACFTPGGRYARPVLALLRQHSEALGAEPPVIALTFYACWLRHARNERVAAQEGQPHPFLDIVRWIAAHPEVPLPGRSL